MFFDKKKYLVQIYGGRAVINTDKLAGRIEHLIVQPVHPLAVWDIQIQDLDGDVIFSKNNFSGRLDDRSGLAIGRSAAEKLTIVFKNVTHNCLMEVIMLIKEI